MIKNYLLLVLLTLPLFVCAQKVQSTCTASPSIVQLYQEDADRMALDRIYRQNLKYKDSFNIPTVYSDTVLRALLAVYNATSLAARDSVAKYYQIHIYGKASVNSFKLYADSTLPWMRKLRQYNVNTGNPTVDAILSKYSLTVKDVYKPSFASYCEITFKSASNANLQIAMNELKNISGVNYVQHDYYYGSGNMIKDSIYTDHVELVYSYGWGDCHSFCIYRRYWKFNVYFDCSVEYLGSWGNSAPINWTNINDVEQFDFKVYPNPFQHSFSIDGLDEAVEFKLTDVYGKCYKSGICVGGVINDLDLPAGIYLLSFIYKGRTVRLKVQSL